jgi:hypothetical protein
MTIRSAYNDLSDWVENLPTSQYVLFGWVISFTVSLLVSTRIDDTDLRNAIATATGAATGNAIGLYLRRYFGIGTTD